MVSTVSVLGSCVTRDLFYSKVISDYKSYFKLITYQGRSSLISLMSKPVNFNENDFSIGNAIAEDFIKSDFRKDGVVGLVENPPDYLIIDILFDVIYGILYLPDGNIISNNTWDLYKTPFYKNLIEGENDEFKILTISHNTNEYFDAYKNAINSLFNFLKSNCINTKVILNSIRHAHSYIRNDGTIITTEFFKNYGRANNKYFEKLEDYIIDNFDVDILYFGRNYYADESNIWGLAPHHYEKKLYLDKFNQLKNIVKYDKILKENERLLNNNSKLMKEIQDLYLKNKILSEEKQFFKSRTSFSIKENNSLEP